MRKLRDNYVHFVHRRLRLTVVRYRRIRGVLHPIVKFGLSYNGRTVTVEAYADSGAAYSLFSPSDAKRLGINYRSGRLTWVQGVGGTFVPAYLHKLHVVIGRFSFKATVGFSDHIGVGFNLIGRKDIFNRLSFTFNDKYNFLLISNADDIPTSVRTRLGLPVR